jgi:ribonuclease HI
MIECFFDGCCEPINPGGTAAYGVVIFQEYGRPNTRSLIFNESKIFRPIKGREKETSNNVAEYSGFEAILRFLLENKLNEEAIIVHGDSRLVICQMFVACGYRKRWRILGGLYTPIALRCRELLKQFPRIKGEWIPREENNLADELSKAELHKAGVKFKIQPE